MGNPLTYVAVDTAALQHNLRQVRELLAPGVRLLAVVKANGYGHGLEIAARAFAAAGADWLGVSRVEEGVALRQAGVELPVLVFLPSLPEETPALVEHALSATVIDEAGLAALARAAEAAGRETGLHLFTDGGLGRPGAGEELFRLIELLPGFERLRLEGVYMHLDGEAEPNLSLLEVLKPGAELSIFAGMVRTVTQQHLGQTVPVHAVASALLLRRPEWRLDMVRAGTLLYGQYPGSVPAKLQTLQLRPALELRSTVVAVETLPAGMRLGYGGEYRTRRPSRVGLVPLGYARGLGAVPESLARRRYGGLRGLVRALLRREEESASYAGQPAPIVGRIAMDWCLVDLTDRPEVEQGSVLTLPCRRTLLDPTLPRIELSAGAGR